MAGFCCRKWGGFCARLWSQWQVEHEERMKRKAGCRPVNRGRGVAGTEDCPRSGGRTGCEREFTTTWVVVVVVSREEPITTKMTLVTVREWYEVRFRLVNHRASEKSKKVLLLLRSRMGLGVGKRVPTILSWGGSPIKGPARERPGPGSWAALLAKIWATRLVRYTTVLRTTYSTT